MKRQLPRRLLSALLALVLLISSCPVGYAAEIETIPEITESVSETEAPAAAVEETEAAQTEAALGTESEETVYEEETESQETVHGGGTLPDEDLPEETAPGETTPQETVPETEAIPEETTSEETVPVETVPEETVPEETVPEETEPVQLPYGFAGMPEGYVLSEEALAEKQAMIDNRVLETLAGLTAGVDYVENRVIFFAETEEEAAQIAEAYSGELTSWNYGIAKMNLLTATVQEAVEAALDPAWQLPVVSPDYISRVEPMESPDGASIAAVLPEMQTWESWVRENLSNPDPGLLNPGSWNYQWMHDTVGSYAAWGVTTGDSDVVVAVIDTGITTSHTDLKNHIRSVNIGCGTSDAVSHGTHVAGIIAGALGNGSGGAGIAPGVTILNIRASDDYGSFADSDIAAAIRAAVSEGANIINMSLAGPVYSYVVDSAVRYAYNSGVTVIAGAGNTGSNTYAYPACYDGVIAVAATNSADQRTSFSNYGPWIDISAPGEAIYSSVASGGYDCYDGTSMAAPVVAGVAALYMSAMGRHVYPDEMEKILESSATKIKESGMGSGIVNIANMLDGVPPAPYYLIYDGERYYTTKDVIPCDASIYFYESEYESGDLNDALLMTLDGSTPSVKNGVVVNGQYLTGEPLRLNLSPKDRDTTLTVKVARISGMGIMGKVLTLKLKVGGSDDVESITIHAPEYMQPGKTITLSATVNPADTADQSVYWDIAGWSASMSTAKIDSKTGKLTVPKGSGIVRVRATSMADPTVWATWDIDVEPAMPPVAKMTLSHTNAYLYTGTGGTISVISMTTKEGIGLNLDMYDVEWTSSNPKIATVDANGYVYGVSKGTVTITCKVLDGSNKTAKCKVEVRQQVTDIAITGPLTVAPGTSVTYKAVIAPTNATNKKVTWSISGAPAGVTMDAKSGKLTVSKWAPEEYSFSLSAISQDDYGCVGTINVKVRSKCSAVYIGTDGYDGCAAGVKFTNKWLDNSHQVVKSVDLFSLDLDSSYGVDNQVDLDCWYSTVADGITYMWTSSAPQIATVDVNGLVTAHKAGKATITLQALDGSNKKATVTINVTNPVSSISISSNAQRMSSDRHYLAYGKSAKNTAVFANTYGKPGNQKVKWSWDLYIVDRDGNYSNVTSSFANTKWVSVSSSGALSVKKNLMDYWNYYLDMDEEFLVRVYAEATDGTGAYGYLDYTLIRPTTTVKAVGNYQAYASSGYGYAYFLSDQWYNLDASFTATSSNPKVVSVYHDEYGESITWVGTDPSTGLNKYAVRLTMPGYRGSAKITIKAADGSNKSCSFTVKVS